MSQAELNAWLTSQASKRIVAACSDAEFHKGGMMSKSYVDFKLTIEIEGDQLTARHRFSEFEALRKSLQLTYSRFGLIIPPLPPKNQIMGSTDVESSFVKERCQSLTYFCKNIVANPFLCNDNAWIEFYAPSTPDVKSQKNVGEDMINKAVTILEQPFKLTIDSRMDDIRDEIAVVENSVKGVVGAIRKLQEAEKATMAAFDLASTQIASWNANEVARVKRLNGFPFEAMESIIPNQQAVKTSINNFADLDQNKYMAKSALPDQMAVFQICPLTFDMSVVEATRESLKFREEKCNAINSQLTKLEKAEKTAKDAKDALRVEEMKAALAKMELDRENYYKGLIYFSLPMVSRFRSEVYREAYAFMAASYLAETSQSHTACLAFFRSTSINPMTAVDTACARLLDDGLIALNKTSTQYGTDQSLFQAGPVAAPLMHGLLEAAVTGNYSPLYQTQYIPPSAPVDEAAGVFAKMGAKFSDSESDGVAAESAGRSASRASTGSNKGGWADEESIGV